MRQPDDCYAGTGIYSTLQAEYAALYSGMDYSSVLIICCCVVGNVYPLSRRGDYRPPFDKQYFKSGGPAGHSMYWGGIPMPPKYDQGIALKPSYDAHWFTVTQPTAGSIENVECFMWDDSKNDVDESFPPCYDELIVKDANQMLPMAIVHLGAAKADWAANTSFEVLKFKSNSGELELSNLTGLILGCIEAKVCK